VSIEEAWRTPASPAQPEDEGKILAVSRRAAGEGRQLSSSSGSSGHGQNSLWCSCRRSPSSGPTGGVQGWVGTSPTVGEARLRAGAGGQRQRLRLALEGARTCARGGERTGGKVSGRPHAARV